MDWRGELEGPNTGMLLLCFNWICLKCFSRCPECSVLVSDLESHVERRHGENAEKMIVGGEEEAMGEIVRCRHPGCDLFFNNNEEVSEHIKREHTDEVTLLL